VCATVEDADIALLRAAEEGSGPALIAVGTRGTAPAGQLWLGSTALRVLTCASGSVLICPHRAMLLFAGISPHALWLGPDLPASGDAAGR